MKAIILNDFGPAANLQLTEPPIPQIINDQVLIKVNAISINPVDVKSRQGKGMVGGIKERPIILGWDISGEVTESNSSKFKKGDEKHPLHAHYGKKQRTRHAAISRFNEGRQNPFTCIRSVCVGRHVKGACKPGIGTDCGKDCGEAVNPL